MSEKKKFTVYVGSVVLCVGVAVLLHYVSFTNPYLQSICHLLRPFIYIGLYLVWAISFQMIIPGLFEPPVRTLRATIPENESHIFR